jgi:hypothetical protein
MGAQINPDKSGPYKNYFFVVGFPRSGTTLLSVLLDRHSRLCVPPETGFFDEIAPQLSEGNDSALMTALENWRRLPELGLEPEMVRNQLQKKQWNSGDVLAAILDAYALRQQKTRPGEKTPQHLLHVPAILEFFPQARIICLLRDGRDASLSLVDMPWGWSLRAAAELWQRYLRLMEEFQTLFSDNFMVLSYEQLVAAPDETMKSVMDFLSESFEPQQLNSDTPSKVVLSRSMLWKGKSLEPIDVRCADRRRVQASRENLELLERILRDDLRRYGFLS